MGISLDDEEKGVLKYLDTSNNYSSDFDEIKNYLANRGYNLSSRDLSRRLDHLTSVGYIRSKNYGVGPNKVEKFYLSKVMGGLLGGTAKRKSLQGRGAKHDLSTLVKRWFGVAFLLFGLGFFVYNAGVTGNVISEGGSSGFVFIPVIALIIIGAILLKGSFKK